MNSTSAVAVISQAVSPLSIALAASAWFGSSTSIAATQNPARRHLVNSCCTVFRLPRFFVGGN
jgi:hypothetical protein